MLIYSSPIKALPNDIYFWYANHGCFRFLSELDLFLLKPVINENNTFYSVDIGDKLIIAINQTDEYEYSGYLLYDKSSKYVYLLSLKHKKPKPILIANSLEELFETDNVANKLMEGYNKELWSWIDMIFEEDKFKKEVPKNVYPSFSMTYFFSTIKNTYLLFDKEFDSVSFRNYFKQYELEKIIPQDFCGKHEELKTLLEKINYKNSKYDFCIVSFNPYSFLGIYDKKQISQEDFDKFIKYDLIEE